MEDASKNLRGKRFERLIVFLLSQVTDFEVVEVNYRTTTEELDAVVQQRSTGGRVWAGLAAPIILVEGKNWKVRVDQPEVSTLLTKMRNKRGTVRIAFLFGRSGFTSDALRQEEKSSSEDRTIVFVGPDEIEEWVAAGDYDDYAERLVRKAMLRVIQSNGSDASNIAISRYGEQAFLARPNSKRATGSHRTSPGGPIRLGVWC